MERKIIGITALLIAILVIPYSSEASCVVHWSCSSSGCAAVMGGYSGTAGPFDTSDDCEQWQSQYDSNSTCDCTNDNSNDSSSPSIPSVPSGGGASMQNQMLMEGTMIGGYMLGRGLHDALFGNPQQQAQKKAQEAAQEAAQKAAAKRQAEERARQRELIKEQLLGEAPSNGNSSGGLHLMGVTPEANLQLMTGGQALAPMTSSVNQTAPKKPTFGKKKVKHSDAFNKGYQAASQCYSSNSGPYCNGLTGKAWQTCLADYRAGYEVGTKEEKMKIDKATQLGQLDAEDGKPNNGFNVTNDTGDCRRELDMAYTNGYGQVSRGKTSAGSR